MSNSEGLPQSGTGGVKPMSIEGRFGPVRARLSPEFTDADRAWRKQWLKDQILAADEPRFVPEHYYATKNIFRRIYRAPLDAAARALVPKIGAEYAGLFRRLVPTFFWSHAFLVLAFYWVKYNPHDWTRIGGWSIRSTEPACLPCHSDYPRPRVERKPQDYADDGFQTRKVLLDI